MKLAHLNKLVKSKIEKSEVRKSVYARRLGIEQSHLNYKIENGSFEWDEIRKLKLPVKYAEFKRALSKDFRGLKL